MTIEMTVEEPNTNTTNTIVEYKFKNEYKTIEGEYDAEKYFKTADEIKNYIANHPIKFWEDFDDEIYLNLKNSKNVEHFINEIDTNIESNKLPRLISEYQALNLSSIRKLIDNLSNFEEQKILKYKEEYQKLLYLSKATKEKSFDCLKNNWEEIKEYLSTFLINKAEQAKLRLKQSQAKYYQKKKALLGIESKPKLTAEEKAEKYKDQLKRANKKYYEKKRTELIELGIMKPKQTPDEKRIAKQEANKRYYASKKQKLETLVEP